jgi:hypothetical protein
MKLIGRIQIFLFAIFVTLNFNKCNIKEKYSNQDNSFHISQLKENMTNNLIVNYFQKITENFYEEYYKYFDGFKILMNELYKKFYDQNLFQYNENSYSEYKYNFEYTYFKRERKLFNSTNPTNTTDNKFLLPGNFR